MPTQDGSDLQRGCTVRSNAERWGLGASSAGADLVIGWRRLFYLTPEA